MIHSLQWLCSFEFGLEPNLLLSVLDSSSFNQKHQWLKKCCFPQLSPFFQRTLIFLLCFCFVWDFCCCRFVFGLLHNDAYICGAKNSAQFSQTAFENSVNTREKLHFPLHSSDSTSCYLVMATLHQGHQATHLQTEHKKMSPSYTQTCMAAKPLPIWQDTHICQPFWVG